MGVVTVETPTHRRLIDRNPPAGYTLGPGSALPPARRVLLKALDYFRTFFFPATVFFGPLRVRALVRVR